MRIAISGAQGFIGAALATELHLQGHEIHPIVRRRPRPGEIGINLAQRSLDCTKLEGGHIGAVDVIYHLAGEPISPQRWGAKKREAIRASRIASTDLIARAIAAAPSPPSSFITMSAIGYYGDRDDEIITEENGMGKGFLAEVCQAWESATSPAKAIGVRVAHARTGVVIGKGGGILKSLRPIFSVGLGARIGDGRQWMSPISLSDEVKALIFLGTNDTLTGPFNLTSPIPVTNAQFTAALGRTLNRPTFFRIPAFGVRLIMGRRTALEIALISQRVLPTRLQASGFSFDYPLVGDAFKVAC
jgi:hypothetical protein